MIAQPAEMIMQASQGHQRIPSASALAGKVETLGFEVTRDCMQPIDNMSQQNLKISQDFLQNCWCWKV